MATFAVVATAFVSQPAAAAVWCGNDVQAADRLPEATAGHQIHVVYAIPSDGADRFAEVAPLIVDDLEHVVAWWRREDAARVPRFDRFAFPGCGTELGQLDLSFVRLPGPTDRYSAIADAALTALAEDVSAAGHSNDFKRYLVYYDGAVQDVDVCGTAFQGRLSAGTTFAAVWLRSHPGFPGCGELGGGGYVAVTSAHELMHALGAVPREAGPVQACPDDAGHVCSPENDLMTPGGGGPLLADRVLDGGRDDYYGHGGGWTDVQDSPWLARLDLPSHPLTIELVGAGPGDAVETDVPGVLCPPACAVGWQSGYALTLLATEGNSDVRRFLRWVGPGCGASLCSFVMDAPVSVRAVFGPARQRLLVVVRGRGRVVSGGLNLSCTARCSRSVSIDLSVQLTARPTRGWRFVGWSGACRSKGRCVVGMAAPRTVTATFRGRS